MYRGFACDNKRFFQKSESSSTIDTTNFYFEKFISEIFLDESLQHQTRKGSCVKKSNVVLVNGAPGIGKTTLCKEIAYQWAKENEKLKHNDLILLLFLRDPKVLEIQTLENFVHYFYGFEPSASEYAKNYAKLLSNCNNVTIILDGFDEFHNTHSDLLVSRIISRQVLPQSKLIITSRPFASESLQSRADIVKVEMVGFSEQSKVEYIKKELGNYPDKTENLLSLLENHNDIKSICYIPIILNVLVFIFKHSDKLPTNQVELYDYFIHFVISRSRQRLGNISLADEEILPLDKLPPEYQDYLLGVSQFAFEHMKSKQVVFTQEDLNRACSNFNLNKNDFNGLGLLNYTKHTEVVNYKVTKVFYYNFVHSSIQEYLAAYYISSVELHTQFHLLKSTFFVGRYLTTWNMFAQMKRSNMIDCKQVLVYSNMQKTSEEMKSKLLIKNVFKMPHTFDFTDISDNFKLLCFKIGEHSLLENQQPRLGSDKMKHFVAYLSLSNNINNTSHIEIYLLYNNSWNTSYEEITKGLLQNHNLSVMIVENDRLLGYRISQHQLIDGLGINNSLHYIILGHCHITVNMANVLSSYFKENHNFKGLCLTKSAIDKLQLNITSLKFIILEDCNLSAGNLKDLAEWIKMNPLLEYIGLQNNNLRSSATGILQALQANTKLKGLDLNNNNMGDTVTEIIAGIIKNNNLIELLDIGNNNFSLSAIAILKALANLTTLHIIDLSCSIIGDIAKDLADVIKSNCCLETLRLANNDLRSSAVLILQALKGNSKLKELNLNNNNMTGVIAEDLADVIKSNSCIEMLGLANNELRSSAVILQALKGNSKLKQLNLDNNNMTGVIAEDLADVIKSNSCIETLELANNDLRSSAAVILQALKENSKLKELDLDNNNMTGVIAEDLADVIKNNNCLEKLWLANNDLRSSAVVILQALKGNSKLKVLNLNNNNMTGVITKDLVDVIKSNNSIETLGLANNELRSSAAVILQALKGNSKLKELNLDNNNVTGVIAKDLADVIKSNSCIEMLGLANNELRSSAAVILQALKENSKLKELDLDNNNMTGVIAEDLADVIKSNNCLEKLSLANNDLRLSAVVILQTLKGISELKELNLDNNNMTSVVAKDLVDVIKSNDCLEKLWLENNDLRSSAVVILQALKGNSGLKVLNLNNNNMTGVIAKDLADVIKSNNCLEELVLANNDLRSSAIVILQGLKGNSKLKELYLDNNNMTGIIAKDLADVIKSNIWLETLGLANNDLRSSAVVILQALKRISELKILNLDNNNMTGVIAKDLADVIKSNNCIEMLGLANNELRSSAVVIFQALKGISKLQILNLGNNNMTGVIAEDLADVIKSNSCIEVLGLANNELRSSAIVILQALKGNSKLKQLNLDNNNMTGVVAEDLADVIKSNSLEMLWLANNNLRSSAVVILQALKGNSELKLLNLNNNNMTVDIAKDLVDVIKSNICLEILELANNDWRLSLVISFFLSFILNSN